MTDYCKECGQSLPSSKFGEGQYGVILTNVGDKKIHVIQEARAATDLSLKLAKDLVDIVDGAFYGGKRTGRPQTLLSGIPRREAELVIRTLEAAGASAELDCPPPTETEIQEARDNLRSVYTTLTRP